MWPLPCSTTAKVDFQDLAYFCPLINSLQKSSFRPNSLDIPNKVNQYFIDEISPGLWSPSAD